MRAAIPSPSLGTAPTEKERGALAAATAQSPRVPMSWAPPWPCPLYSRAPAPLFPVVPTSQGSSSSSGLLGPTGTAQSCPPSAPALPLCLTAALQHQDGAARCWCNYLQQSRSPKLRSAGGSVGLSHVALHFQRHPWILSSSTCPAPKTKDLPAQQPSLQELFWDRQLFPAQGL